MSDFQMHRHGLLMEPEPGNPMEVEGVLNPAAARGPDDPLYLFPRLVPWPTTRVPKVLTSSSITLRALVREYLFISPFRACAKFLASENASPLASMQRADRNRRTTGDAQRNIPPRSPKRHRRGSVRRRLRL